MARPGHAWKANSIKAFGGTAGDPAGPAQRQQLPADARPTPSVADYDQLLTATTTGSGRRA
jgi:hypothetical protein